MGSTTIHPFPELRVYAEEEARALMCAIHATEWERRTRSAPRPMPEGWATADAAMLQTLTESHLTLLCDLTRPMSRYAVSVLVGNRIGWDGHSVALSVETGGINIHALFRDCGFKAEPSLNAGADLALIVRHLWPKESPDAR